MFSFLSEKLSGVLGWLKGKGRLTEEQIAKALEQVHDALLEADVPYEVVQTFLQQVKTGLAGQALETKANPGDYLIKIVHDKLCDFLSGDGPVSFQSFIIPSVVMVMGLQGSGKTTTVAKLAQWVIDQAAKRGKKRKILAASVDFYRPAAVEQLKILADQIGISFYTPQATDPVHAAREIHQYFKQNSFELLFLDTAGRLQIDAVMMQELKNIEVLLKPRYKYLVLDAMTGQQSLNVAESFDHEVGFDGALLTKMDSDTRAGAAFAFRYVVKKPILFVGTGEKVEDLEQFHPKRIAGRILGMGDLETLIERADHKIDAGKQQSMANKLMSGHFNLADFTDQMNAVGKLGSMSKIMQFIPGAAKVSTAELEQGQKNMVLYKAIISSMTLKERHFPQLLDGTRKKRIARGSGTSVMQVNQLLEKFEQSKQFVKMIKKSGKSRRHWG